MEVITTTTSELILLMTELAIQFYPIWPSLIISVLSRGRGKNFPRSWAQPTLNLDSPDQIVKYKSMKYIKKEETEERRI